VIDDLFDLFSQQIEAAVFRAQNGQIIDAAIIPVPKAAQQARRKQADQSGADLNRPQAKCAS
jgi:hypothetical protein